MSLKEGKHFEFYWIVMVLEEGKQELVELLWSSTWCPVSKMVLKEGIILKSTGWNGCNGIERRWKCTIQYTVNTRDLKLVIEMGLEEGKAVLYDTVNK